MKVAIKSFDVQMELKTNGIELEIKDTKSNDHKFLGDCFVTMTGLIWCKGKTEKDNGIKVSWKELMELCETKEKLKAALKAAKNA